MPKVNPTRQTIPLLHRYSGLAIYATSAACLRDVVIEAVRNKVSLEGVDLHGEDLRKADLRGADLRNANLQGANLADASVAFGDLRHADLRHAILIRADMHAAGLAGAVFHFADLKEVRGLDKANRRGADFLHTCLAGSSQRPAYSRKFSWRLTDGSGHEPDQKPAKLRTETPQNDLRKSTLSGAPQASGVSLSVAYPTDPSWIKEMMLRGLAEQRARSLRQCYSTLLDAVKRGDTTVAEGAQLLAEWTSVCPGQPVPFAALGGGTVSPVPLAAPRGVSVSGG